MALCRDALNLALCRSWKALQALLQSDCHLCSPCDSRQADTTEQSSGFEANKCYAVSFTSALCWQVSTAMHL